MRRGVLSLALILPLAACSEAVTPPGGNGGGGSGSGGSSPDAGLPGKALSVPVPSKGRTYVKLATPEIASAAGPTTTDWDLAFEGLELYTNSGPSGPGMGGGFGPLDGVTFLDDVAPTVPFMTEDAPGGAFLDWYFYDGAAHVIYSRYHVFGIREGNRVWKVQLLGYYGEAAGAPVSALWQLRYAEVTAAGAGPTQTVKDLDGTAGGTNPPPTATSGCLDLGTGTITQLTPEAAQKSSAWHLCFRRSEVTVNGGLGGPRGVTAADLDAASSASETLDQLKAVTAASALPGFDKVTYAALTDPKVTYRPDGVVSAFTGKWIDSSKSPIKPANATWLVREPASEVTYMVYFEGFTDPTGTTPGTVNLRVKVAK